MNIPETGVNTEDNPYKPQTYDLAGVDMGGRRQPDGTILVSTSGTNLEDWPECILLCGSVFTLEEIHHGRDGWENAIYV